MFAGPPNEVLRKIHWILIWFQDVPRVYVCLIVFYMCSNSFFVGSESWICFQRAPLKAHEISPFPNLGPMVMQTWHDATELQTFYCQILTRLIYPTDSLERFWIASKGKQKTNLSVLMWPFLRLYGTSHKYGYLRVPLFSKRPIRYFSLQVARKFPGYGGVPKASKVMK